MSVHLPRTRSLARTGLQAAVAAVCLAVLAAPALVATSADARPAETRHSTAPNVMFPVAGGVGKNLGSRNGSPGVEIAAPCGSVVRAAHPGRIHLHKSPFSGPNLVTVVTTPGRLTTYYGYMSKADVKEGQLIQAGQPIGVVGREGIAIRCSLYFAVTGNSGEATDATWWLDAHVGNPMNSTNMYGSWGMMIGSYNTLGASHTKGSGKYAGYAKRTDQQIDMFERMKMDVIGLQEFQKVQWRRFVKKVGNTWGVYPDTDKMDTENSIIYRKSTVEFISGEVIRVPYFNGNIRKMPVVKLRDKRSGVMFYMINVHNPASIPSKGDQSKWRAKAVEIERKKVVELRASRLPVFLTGDFNAKKPAFCPLTEGKLMISPDSIPSMTCSPPEKLAIDWVFAAGPARFSRYARDYWPRRNRLSDHPIVWTRAHLTRD